MKTPELIIKRPRVMVSYTKLQITLMIPSSGSSLSSPCTLEVAEVVPEIFVVFSLLRSDSCVNAEQKSL